MSDVLAAAVAESLVGRGPRLERSLLGLEEPEAIARAYDAFCREQLGASIAGAPFYRTSAGCVAGLALSDGRRVVVKAHRAGATRIERCLAVRRALLAAGFPAPRPLAGPAPLGGGLATAEELLSAGAEADPREPSIRRAMAASLHRLLRLGAPLAPHCGLGRAWYSSLPEDRLWPRPHSPLIDFDASREGAGWIDDLAAAARSRRDAATGALTVGHFDWRVEHLRFDGDRVVATFDWDSLHADLETVAVGAAAHAFTVDGTVRGTVPTAPEIHAFVAAYEGCRDGPFTAAERATAMASCVYSLAYSARCNHALHPHEHGFAGDFRPLLRDWGEALLAS